MRVHLVAPVPHRDVTVDWEPCAFTGKALRLARMLTGQGHTVIQYGGPRTDAPAAEHVPVFTDEQRTAWFGGNRYVSEVFNQFDPAAPCWAEFNSAAIAAIRERWQPGDIVGIQMGSAQAPIAEAFAGRAAVAETGVGYTGVVAGTHRCYESHAWQAYLWGRTGVDDGRLFDTVIPNAYDPADYLFSADKEDFILFLGRMTSRKGLEAVAQLARRHRVLTAGPGGERVPGAEHLGVVAGRDKAELLAAARALVCYPTYVEPFGGVAVEAQLSGTPVLAVPYGAFPETVRHGETGFLCHTLAELFAAADAADSLDPKGCREWALSQFTLEVAAPQFTAWLRRLGTLYDKGWYQC